MRQVLIYGLGAVLCAVPMAAVAQKAKPAASAYKSPRNVYGQPDLDGYWSNATITPMNRPARYGNRAVLTPQEVAELEGGAAAQAEAGNRKSDPNAAATGSSADVGGYNRGWLDPGSQVMRVRGEPRSSILTTPNGLPPLRKGATAADAAATAAALAAGGGGGQGNVAAQRAALLRGAFNNPENRSLGERCLTSFGRNLPAPMQGNGFYNNNYQFMQTRDAVAIHTEMVHDIRIVPLNTKHRTDGVRPWFGDSIGWYEGDTLVVETTNFPQRQAYQGSWQTLKVTERFTRVAKDGILYQFTIEDPATWEKPWGGEYQFTPLNGEIHEYACHEGNYALEGILAGAREEEKKIAAETQPVAAR